MASLSQSCSLMAAVGFAVEAQCLPPASSAAGADAATLMRTLHTVVEGARLPDDRCCFDAPRVAAVRALLVAVAGQWGRVCKPIEVDVDDVLDTLPMAAILNGLPGAAGADGADGADNANQRGGDSGYSY
ncbi:hypothetical protein I4F81_009890 [Pyropia yezoensis]|uniref:Uncharacterized protein n=1 Tax=Pyropia yezoensis TaxID=2788 RepID=A0ACC3CBB5_PYRYE|nr:hypothetical protein I4F81_009890 [Neopyropia yezoensis]